MASICFVRHGETNWNKERRMQGREDIPLNQTGRNQARMAGQYLQAMEWDLLISSPLIRARQTAEEIKAHLDVPEILLMDEFIERDFGEASGKLVADVKEHYLRNHIKNMEQENELTERLLQGLSAIVETHLNKNIIVVSHGVAIKALLKTVVHDELPEDFQLSNACFNHIRFKDGKWELITFNGVEHLY